MHHFGSLTKILEECKALQIPSDVHRALRAMPKGLISHILQLVSSATGIWTFI